MFEGKPSGNSRALFDIQLPPESLVGGLMDKSAGALSFDGGGSFEVRVEMEGRVWFEGG